MLTIFFWYSVSSFCFSSKDTSSSSVSTVIPFSFQSIPSSDFLVTCQDVCRFLSSVPALNKIAPSGGRWENFWAISWEKSRFYAKKNHIFSNFRGGGPPPPPESAPGYRVHLPSKQRLVISRIRTHNFSGDRHWLFSIRLRPRRPLIPKYWKLLLVVNKKIFSHFSS
jgi:hypothetical protein